MIKINESPRETFQSLKSFISTDQKAEYVNILLKAGYTIVDVGSFVSDKLFPNLKDTGQLIDKLECNSETEISVLAGNVKYAEAAADYDQINYINFPFSISESLQKRNLNMNIDQSRKVIDGIIDLCIQKKKNPIISLAAGFGNPFNDDWGIDILMDHIEFLYEAGLRYIPLADTTGSGSVHLIGLTFSNVIREFPDVEFNFHLHTKKEEAIDKIAAAYLAGCRNFDSVIKGIGACLSAGKENLANLDTNVFIEWLNKQNIKHNIKSSFFKIADEKAAYLFID